LAVPAYAIAGCFRSFPSAPPSEFSPSNLSPERPQGIVDNLLISFAVGALQRLEIKQWRGFRLDAFGYNEGPTSSCHTFCWKARQVFDVPFF
jgi:hypothetical protein